MNERLLAKSPPRVLESDELAPDSIYLPNHLRESTTLPNRCWTRLRTTN